jgi:stage II sporulation protein D
MVHMIRAHRALALVGMPAMLALLGGSVAPAAAPPPAAFRIVGSGAGHGVGMSQWGAYSMALAGYGASSIIAHYYPGAAVRPAKLPDTISVGLLQANLDPRTRKRLSEVRFTGRPLGGVKGSGAVVVTGYGSDGRVHRRYLPGGISWSVRPQAGGMSVFGPDGRVFGPATLDGSGGLVVRYGAGPGVRVPGLLSMPQAGRTLRWGQVEIRAVRDDQGVMRPRAVLVIGVNSYLRGLGEVPSLWPAAVLQAQAIAARSYAVFAVQRRGQHRDQAVWTGCDCAIYPDVRDQAFVGWSKEGGQAGARWVSAVETTRSLVVRFRGKLVQAFYSASSGGRTQSVSVWGGPDASYLPVQRDPWDCARRGGRCRNPNWRWTEVRSASDVAAALRELRVGRVRAIRLTSVDSSGRVRAATVSGTRRSASISGGDLRRLLRVKSTRFTVTPA